MHMFLASFNSIFQLASSKKDEEQSKWMISFIQDWKCLPPFLQLLKSYLSHTLQHSDRSVYVTEFLSSFKRMHLGFCQLLKDCTKVIHSTLWFLFCFFFKPLNCQNFPLIKLGMIQDTTGVSNSANHQNQPRCLLGICFPGLSPETLIQSGA